MSGIGLHQHTEVHSSFPCYTFSTRGMWASFCFRFYISFIYRGNSRYSCIATQPTSNVNFWAYRIFLEADLQNLYCYLNALNHVQRTNTGGSI